MPRFQMGGVGENDYDSIILTGHSAPINCLTSPASSTSVTYANFAPVHATLRAVFADDARAHSLELVTCAVVDVATGKTLSHPALGLDHAPRFAPDGAHFVTQSGLNDRVITWWDAGSGRSVPV